MKPKILFILHLPPPVHGASMVGTYIKESEIINSRFSCRYINLSTSERLNSIGKYSVRKPVMLLKILLKLFKELITASPDVCYMTMTASGPGFYKDMFMVCILKLFNKKIIYHFHNKGEAVFSKNRLNAFLYKICFKNTSSILLSEKLYPDIASYVNKQHVFYCPNGIPENKGNLPIVAGKRSQKPVSLLFMSNMMAEKGVYVLMDTCKILKDKKLDFVCHFVGAWSDVSKKDFDAGAFERGISDRVFSHGSRYGDEKRQFFLEADIFVFPTYYHNECFPLVLLEALSCGLSIVTTPEGGIADIVLDGENGYLVPQKDAVSLASGLEILMNQPELRTRMGTEGYKRFKDYFTIEKFEHKMIEILNTVSVKDMR